MVYGWFSAIATSLHATGSSVPAVGPRSCRTAVVVFVANLVHFFLILTTASCFTAVIFDRTVIVELVSKYSCSFPVNPAAVGARAIYKLKSEVFGPSSRAFILSDGRFHNTHAF